ncbi:MAG: DSD1 family PLP-dependent enzyme [Burkholderiaceae bacterium]|nr:DSD1 family PLP-dependent enzyme [Burkholderiaceae bacterium]
MIAAPARVGDAFEAIDTPALLVDLDAFERNVAAAQAHVNACGARLRPHGKAHRCSTIAMLQIAAGATGVCCQKVGEAEVFVAAGIADVLVTNVVVGESKARRLAALGPRARVAVCVDSLLQIEQIASAVRALDTHLDLLIEIDVGNRRCGVDSPGEAVDLARAIAAHAPWLSLRGLQAYHGKAQHLRSTGERAVAIGKAAAQAALIASALRADGHECAEVTGAGTGTYPYELASGVYTEVQPGSYALMDLDYGANQRDPDAPPTTYALSLLATVITVRCGHAVLDCGHKSVAIDSGAPRVELGGWRVRGLSDEHTVIEKSGEAEALAVGQKVRMLPGHCDPTVNLHDWIVATRGERVEALWPVDARGASF